jgi:hypothetical protein
MPDCRIELIVDATEYDPIVIIGEIAHVAAASDGGPRADANLSITDRNDYENLILLCHLVSTGNPARIRLLASRI